MKIDIIAGARPNFIKIAPLIHQIKSKIALGYNFTYRLVHTGQHYDKEMNEVFFKELNIPNPEINFGSGGGTQAEQTGKIMIAYEKLLSSKKPDLCIVVGDVNSTLACAIVAKKMHVKVAHIEAGIRSNDLKMPEEINRMVTDSISDYFFTTTIDASNNLKNLGINNDNIFFVGNIMIDTLITNLNKLEKPDFFDKYKLTNKEYIVLTMHRPSNVDKEEELEKCLMEILNCTDKKIIFPVHPRTKKIINKLKFYDNDNIIMVNPLSYLQFNYLVKNSYLVITDSGGITEETTLYGVPCMTFRDSTERPETVELGTNVLIGKNPKNFSKYFDILKKNKWKEGKIPDLWDGKTSDRILEKIIHLFSLKK